MYTYVQEFLAYSMRENMTVKNNNKSVDEPVRRATLSSWSPTASLAATSSLFPFQRGQLGVTFNAKAAARRLLHPFTLLHK